MIKRRCTNLLHLIMALITQVAWRYSRSRRVNIRALAATGWFVIRPLSPTPTRCELFGRSPDHRCRQLVSHRSPLLIDVLSLAGRCDIRL